MSNIIIYGFQFPHHGSNSAFIPFKKEMISRSIPVCEFAYPKLPKFRPKRIRDIFVKQWYRINELRIKSAFESGKTVHYFFPENSLYEGGSWRDCTNSRLILTCHQPASRIINAREGLLKAMKVADKIVLMAPTEIQAYSEVLSHDRISFVPYGVDSNFFTPLSKINDEKNKQRSILTIGNWMRDYKVWAETVDIIESVSDNITFTVIANSSTLNRVRSYNFKSRPNVRYLVNISDKQLLSEYRSADILFLPLKNALANTALLEGMACGCTIVITDLPATRAYGKDAVCYIEKCSSTAASNQILSLLSNIPFTRSLGAKARSVAEREYTWSKIAYMYVNNIY
mgnify:CR=1 FL=1